LVGEGLGTAGGGELSPSLYSLASALSVKTADNPVLVTASFMVFTGTLKNSFLGFILGCFAFEQSGWLYKPPSQNHLG
jgi:hypothetical protein